jgi:hypothetical protein
MSFRPSFPPGGQKAAWDDPSGSPGPASTAPPNAPEAGPSMKE